MGVYCPRERKSEMVLEKLKLITYGFLEVAPNVDIKVTDGIASHFCILPQFFLGFGTYWS